METLPNHFAVQQKPDICPSLYILLKTSYNSSRQAWNLELVGSPRWILMGMKWRTDGIESIPRIYKCITKNNEISDSTIYRTKNYMIVPGLSVVPILKMSYMRIILSENIQQYTQQDKYHFSVNSLQEIMRNPLPPAPVEEPSSVRRMRYYEEASRIQEVAVARIPVQTPVQTAVQTPNTVRAEAAITAYAETAGVIRATFAAKIPQHIFKIYLEKAIQSEETCPITLEKFTLENAACTPCGHLFDRDAIKMNLQRSSSCPTCRTKISENELQTL